MKIFVFSLLFLLISRGNTPAGIGKLEEGFAHPPPECRPQVLWDWMGGLISRDGITKDLEAMTAQGIGGVLVMQMPDQCPYPYSWSFRDYPGKVKCLSDDYFATVNYAIGEADRLGIKFGIFACPGWSHLGGPWVRPEQGLKKIAASRTFVSGPTNLDIMVPKPSLSPGYYGGDGIPQWSADAQRLLQPEFSSEKLRAFDGELHGNGLKFGPRKPSSEKRPWACVSTTYGGISPL